MLECSVVKNNLRPIRRAQSTCWSEYNKTKVKSFRLYNKSNTSIFLIEIENFDLYLAQFYKYAY